MTNKEELGIVLKGEIRLTLGKGGEDDEVCKTVEKVVKGIVTPVCDCCGADSITDYMDDSEYNRIGNLVSGSL